MNEITVVAVDDELPLREALGAYRWEDAGARLVEVACNGQEALPIIRDCKPDLVLTDIRMPLMDGLTLLRHIRAERYECEVVMLTHYGEFEYAREALRHGAADYILKEDLCQERIAELIQAFAERKGRNEPGTAPEGRLRYEIQQAVDYLHEHYDQPLTLRGVSLTVGLSPKYLGQLFKEETGEPFVDYLNRIRLDKAAQLLHHSGLKVYEVGERVGLPNYRYFSQLFKAHTGYTPTQYKKG